MDTSVWVDWFRDRSTSGTRELERRISDDEAILLTDVVLTEVLQGARSEADAARLAEVLAAHEALRLEALDDFRHAARLYRGCRRRGITVRRSSDCLIAAVCIREDLPLLHADAEFDRIAACSDLQVVSTLR